MLAVKTEDGVTTLRLEHGKANALDVELVAALDGALKKAETDAATKAVVLTGTGTIFCAGVDLFRVVQEGRAYAERFLKPLSAMFLRLFAFPKPVVAAVNGHAIAGGCVMTCAADYRLMVDGKATIGVPELKVGVPFPLVAIEILRFATAPGRLQELLFIGKTYAAKDAVQHGLVDEIVPATKLEQRALEVATRLIQEPVARFRITKQQLRGPSLDAIARRSAETDGAMIRAWEDPKTIEAIGRYLKDAVGKRG